MAKFKRDEVRGFGFLWLVTGGIFAALSAWAVYNDAVTRTPWRNEQKQFFRVELDQAQRALARAQAVFQTRKDYDNGTRSGAEKLAQLEAEQKQLLAQKNQDPYASLARELKQLDAQFADAEQNKTFAKSDLDEAYYYRVLAEYARDVAEGKARDKLEAKYPGNGRVAGQKAFLDPPTGTTPSSCPPRLVPLDGCADLLHVENEVLRNKAHAQGARDAAKEYPDAGAELLEAAQKAGEVAARVELEIKHQRRIDAARAAMEEIDDKRKAAKAKMAPTDSKLEELEREIAKIRRPIEDAERRLEKAKTRANPKFDVGQLIASLVGVYEIDQQVTTWNGKMQVDRCMTCHQGVDSGNYTDPSVPRKFRTHPRRAELFTTHPIEKFGCTSCHQGQGRATEAAAAHSQLALQEHHGESRWEPSGDEYWEDQMLAVGALHRVVIDDRNDALEVDVAGKYATVTLPHQEYATEGELLGALQSLVQAELAKNAALSKEWRARLARNSGRVEIGLEPLTPAAESVAKKPTMKVRFKKPELGDLLGFSRDPHVAGSPFFEGVMKCTPVCVAPLPPTVPVRNADPILADGKYAPPSGRNGMQIPPAYRDRFIQALPATEAGCVRCHSGDNDLRPHKSKAQWVFAQREKALRQVQTAACKPVVGKACDPKDADCANAQDECKRLLTAEPIELGEDPERMTDLAPTVSEGRSLFRRLNCTGCHILDGFPGNRNAGPQLNTVSAKVNPKFLLQWIRYPRAWRAKTRMPNLWPAPIDPESKLPYPPSSAEYARWETKMKSETLAIASFLWERSEHPEQRPKDAREAPVAPSSKPLRDEIEAGYGQSVLASLGSNAEEGKKIFDTVGCRGCHAVGDDEAEPWKARERDIAPNLGNMGNKSGVAWMAYWIENPTRYWHGTRMPNLRLSKAEAGSVALYIAQQKAEAKGAAPVGDDEVRKLTDAESRKALAKDGAALIANYGCFGCHQISGYESYAPIAPELNGYSKKDTHTIDFGYAITNHHQQTWETFTTWKLDAPRIYRTDRIELRMGDFDLSPREIRSLMVFLKGLAEEEVRPDLNPKDHESYKAMMEGRELVEEYNCRGCHLVEGLGNDVGSTTKKDRQFMPPFLTAEGARVQPEWLYSFLQAPGDHPIRPFLHPQDYFAKVPDDRRAIRMPTFPLEPAQITSIIRYFATWDGQEYPFQTPKVDKLDHDHKLSALIHLNSNDDGGVRCVQCHFVNTLTKERAVADWEALAPNLANAPKRLRPQWVKAWIESPKDFLPYTKMPPLWTDTSGDPAPFGPPKPWTRPPVKYSMGDDQIVAIRNFIYSLKPDAALPPVGAEESSPLVSDQEPAEGATAANEGEGAAAANPKGGAAPGKGPAKKGPVGAAPPAPKGTGGGPRAR